MTRFTRRGRARLCSVAKKARSHPGIGGRLARMSVDRAFLGRGMLFGGLEDAALDAVLSPAPPRRPPAGFALSEQDEAPRALSLVTQGRVKVGHLSPDGRSLTVAFLGPGE